MTDKMYRPKLPLTFLLIQWFFAVLDRRLIQVKAGPIYEQFYYRAMHFSAERGLAIACRLSVRLPVCNVDGLWSHRLEILETDCTVN